MKEKIEIRTFPMEFRADGDVKKLVGYSAVFDQFSDDLGGFKEIIRKGTFARTIIEDDVRALFNHDEDYVIGRNRNGTLKLEEDDHGLKVEIIPPDTQFAKDLMTLIERGDINQMSFGFITRKDQWDETDPNNIVRTLLDVQLWDVSPVTYPAFKQTSIGVRTAEEIYTEFRNIQLLRNQETVTVSINNKRNRIKMYEKLIMKGK